MSNKKSNKIPDWILAFLEGRSKTSGSRQKGIDAMNDAQTGRALVAASRDINDANDEARYVKQNGKYYRLRRLG